MLEGLEISILKLSEILKDNIEFRSDSEYFSKKYLEFNSFLDSRSSDRISKYAKVSDGDHSKFPDNQIDEVRYLQAKDIKKHFIEDYNPVYISKEYFNKNKRSHVTEENIILSIMGSVGDIAITPKDFIPTLANRAVAIIKEIKVINPYYLFTYLSTKYGQLQIDRQKNGGVQERINLDVLSKIRIPFIENNFQKTIEKTIKDSHLKRKESRQTYSQAETLLLETLGLIDFEPTTEAVNIKNFKESFLSSGRLDAEYYQKKYEEIIARVKSHKYDQLGNLVDIKKSIEPGSDAYQEEGVPFIRISNLNKMGLSEPDIHLDGVKYKDVVRPRKDTILLSKDGSVGIAYKVSEDMNAITSGAILHLSVKTDEVFPDYLTLVLNSKVVQMQAERDAGGSILQHWKPSEIEQVEIPIIDKQTQEKIALLVSDSFMLKKQSEQLLETAKRAVEIAIEESEEVAMQFIQASQAFN